MVLACGHRNSNTYANSPGQRLIDLHGLHVSEAIPFLKREIAQLRYNTRNTRQRETVFICVGTGHHTKGSRTPSRLPAAVQKYLLEEEHLQFTEPQAGMLRIILRWRGCLSLTVYSSTWLDKQALGPCYVAMHARQVHLTIASVCRWIFRVFPWAVKWSFLTSHWV